ncbi:hypothetical protein OG339_48585 (plasmid) [Streptosporangium sp. NBC_01495]|uniref:hypothetical protein n=1 Tax=Streptosporangium sp. NBC_01495 TaxID=2903899 RepID=UPI002E31332B|nr:hypothetical protein [Streptosporangium sp. NBC_01495]
MINTTPVELTNAQWAAIVEELGDPTFTIQDFTEVDAVLRSAQAALSDHPLHHPAIDALSVYDTSPEDDADIVVTLDVSGLRLTTEPIGIGIFRLANRTPGEPVIRAVIGELLLHRDRLLSNLTAATAPTQEPLGVVLTREQLEEWAGRPLTDDDVALLDDCIPNSSIPDAVGDIVAGLPSGFDPAVVALAEDALRSAIKRDFIAAAATVREIYSRFGSYGLGDAVITWCDALIVLLPPYPPGQPIDITWEAIDTGYITAISDEVHPAAVWATRMIAARAANNAADLQAATGAIPDEPGPAGGYLLVLLQMVALNIRTIATPTD